MHAIEYAVDLYIRVINELTDACMLCGMMLLRMCGLSSVHEQLVSLVQCVLHFGIGFVKYALYVDIEDEVDINDILGGKMGVDGVLEVCIFLFHLGDPVLNCDLHSEGSIFCSFLYASLANWRLLLGHTSQVWVTESRNCAVEMLEVYSGDIETVIAIVIHIFFLL